MRIKRTADEIKGALMGVQKLMGYPEWAIYHKEVTRLRDAIAEGAYKSKGEDLAKEVGIIKGMNLALYLDESLSGKGE